VASRVDIANLALTKLGSNTKITSFEDNSVAARAISGVYDLVRKAELRKRHWSFALKRAALPALADAPTWGFGYAYQLPTDYLRLMQVGEFLLTPALNSYVTGDASPYAIEGQTIATDFGAPLKIRYVADITDEGVFDALFVTALAARIAFETCEQITQSNQKKQIAASDYKEAIRDAAAVGAIEKPPAPIADDSWMVARL
jgi:hypothetical protein